MDETLSRGYVQLGRSHHKGNIYGHGRGPLGAAGHHCTPPRDPCNCIYLALLLAGVGFLLPYNSFIIAVDYYQNRYPGTTIVFDMSLVYILVAFGAVIINNLLVEVLSLHIRITFGYILSFFTLLFVVICVVCYDVFDLETSYYINLMAVAVVAFGCTVQQSSFYGYTSMLPQRYTQAVMTGESAAGLLISGNRILTKALLDNERVNTIIFFAISIVIVWLCFVIHHVVQRSEFVRFYVNVCNEATQDCDDQRRITLEPTEDLGLVDILDAVDSKSNYGVLKLQSPVTEIPDSAFQSAENINTQNEDKATICESPDERNANHPSYKVQDVVLRMRGTYSTAYTSSVRSWAKVKRGVLARWQVARTVWPYMLSIGLCYFVTLCLFPGIESEVVSCSLGNWMPVILMAIFNLFDFIGKILASVPYDWTRLQLLLCSLGRVVLVPLLVMCAAPRTKPLIPGEGWPMVFSLVLGITNGVFGSVPMIVAPSKVPDELRELTGNIMTLSYSIGLTTGSAIAYLLDEIMGKPLLKPCTTTFDTIYSVTSSPTTSIANISNNSIWFTTSIPGHEWRNTTIML